MTQHPEEIGPLAGGGLYRGGFGWRWTAFLHAAPDGPVLARASGRAWRKHTAEFRRDFWLMLHGARPFNQYPMSFVAVGSPNFRMALPFTIGR